MPSAPAKSAEADQPTSTHSEFGQFDSVSSAANIPLTRLTVVYSENGRGKTTVAAVLRSLATGDAILIAERRRLAAQHPPRVVLDCSGGPPPAIFDNNAWNRTLPDLVVFDNVFIDQNVHSGLAVQAHYRQNLHELILGAQAVPLNTEVQQLVTRIEEHNRELRARDGAISLADRGPFSVEAFCALPARADIEEAIQEATRSLAAARDQDAVRTTQRFDVLTLPEFDIVAIEGSSAMTARRRCGNSGARPSPFGCPWAGRRSMGS